MLSSSKRLLYKQIQRQVSIMGTQKQNFSAASDQPKRIVVTGAAGNIAYSILFRLARYYYYIWRIL